MPGPARKEVEPAHRFSSRDFFGSKSGEPALTFFADWAADWTESRVLNSYVDNDRTSQGHPCTEQGTPYAEIFKFPLCAVPRNNPTWRRYAYLAPTWTIFRAASPRVH